MADGFSSKLDDSQLQANLTRLSGEIAISLARSMCVASGKVLRDEAKLLAPVDPSPTAKKPGALRDSIYLAFNESESNAKQAAYVVSWSSVKAPHGHLVEFGHWQPYKVIRRRDGSYFTDVSRKLPEPRWVAAHPFLRPALDAAGERAVQAALERGRVRLAELLNGQS